MKKIFSYYILVFILMFSCIINTSAECSYKERKQLLEEAKNIEAYIEADLVVKKFDFFMYNLTENLYVELIAPNSPMPKVIYSQDIIEDYYTFSIYDTENPMTYKLIIYSNNSMCFGDKLTTKTIKKGIINEYAYSTECKGIEEYKYCKEIIDKKIPLTKNEVYKNILEYKKSLEPKIEPKKEASEILMYYLTKYWYIPVILIVIVGCVIIMKKVYDKKGEL